MIEIIGFTLGLAFVDCLNPATISTMAVILPLVKRVQHALYFLFSTFLVYFMGGVVLYYGFDRLLKAQLSQFMDQYSLWVFSGEILIGLFLVGFGIAKWFKNHRQTQSKPIDPAVITGLKSVNPSYLFLFGVVSTLSDLPTAFPLVGFIGKMADFSPSLIVFVSLLLIYVLIYVAPLIVLYTIFRTVRDKIKPFTLWFLTFIQKFMKYALPPLLVALGIWAILDGFLTLFSQYFY